jgi:hypothetical protein
MLAADVRYRLRPGAATSPERLFCHICGRGKGQAQMIPGWPYSVMAALEPGRTSWTAVLDAVRLGPDYDAAEVTAVQVREVVTRPIEAGHWCDGDLRVLVVFDAGYDMTRLAWLLADLPMELPGRLRSDRVMQLPTPPRQPGTLGGPRKHGCELTLSDPAACPAPQVTTSAPASRTGRRWRPRGTGRIPGSPTAPPGWITMARCRSSRKRSSAAGRAPHPTMTWENPPNGNAPSRHGAN